MKHILALWGGGARGVLTLEILKRIQRRDWDLIAGTSTGGIIACGLGSGLTVEGMADMYGRWAAEIFSRPWWRRGLAIAKYPSGPRQRVLRAVFGEREFTACSVPTMCTTYDLVRHRAEVMKSWGPPYFETWEVAMATSAAPTYFDSYLGFGDGGLFANNPAACAIAEGMRRWPGEQLRVVSIGTGQRMAGSGQGGIIPWASSIVDVLLSADEHASSYVARALLGDNYIEINPWLIGVDHAMDNTATGHLEELRRIGRQCYLPPALVEL